MTDSSKSNERVIVHALKILAPLSVALIMLARGLGIAPKAVALYFRERPGLILRSLFATLVLVPGAALFLVHFLAPKLGTSIGLATRAASDGGAA